MTLLFRCSDGTCCQTVAPGARTHKTLVIRKSVGTYGVNAPDDVRAIQSAFNLIPEELGGPSIPLAVDGKSGPLTEAQILRYQTVRVMPWQDPSRQSKPFTPDSRIDPAGRTLLVLRIDWEVYSDPNRGGFIPEPELVSRTISAISAARRAIHAAQKALSIAGLALQGVKTLDETAPKLAEAFFGFSAFPRGSGLTELARVDGLFTTMLLEANLSARYGLEGMGTIQRNRMIAYDAPLANGKTALAYTFREGRSKRGQISPDYNVRMDSIYVCAGARKLTSNDLAENLVHELAHFCGPYAGGGSIIDHGYGSELLKLPPAERVRNADNYSAFAMCAAFGTSRRWRSERGALTMIA